MSKFKTKELGSTILLIFLFILLIYLILDAQGLI